MERKKEGKKNKYRKHRFHLHKQHKLSVTHMNTHTHKHPFFLVLSTPSLSDSIVYLPLSILSITGLRTSPPPHTHTHTHIRTHARSHTHTHTHTRFSAGVRGQCCTCGVFLKAHIKGQFISQRARGGQTAQVLDGRMERQRERATDRGT